MLQNMLTKFLIFIYHENITVFEIFFLKQWVIKLFTDFAYLKSRKNVRGIYTFSVNNCKIKADTSGNKANTEDC